MVDEKKGKQAAYHKTCHILQVTTKAKFSGNSPILDCYYILYIIHCTLDILGHHSHYWTGNWAKNRKSKHIKHIKHIKRIKRKGQHLEPSTSTLQKASNSSQTPGSSGQSLRASMAPAEQQVSAGKWLNMTKVYDSGWLQVSSCIFKLESLCHYE